MITVIATDEEGNSANQNVTITITDVDEIDPVITSATAVDYAENGTGTAYTITATDDNELTFSLGTENDESAFVLNGAEVSFLNSPDFETQSSYVITVIATDEEGNTASQDVTITITDVDEIAPVITSATTVDYAENGTGTAYTITATDDNELKFSLGTDNDESAFALNGAELSFLNSPDFETQSSYVITVIATDEEGNAANQNVTITITDVDEIAPVITSATTVDYAENGTGTAYTITATDDNNLTYSLGTDNDESAFALNGAELSFLASPDFETQSSYVITVIATDEEGNTASQDVTITITDVDEIAPVITSATTVDYAENGTGTAYTITATDDNELTFSLGTDNDESAFAITDGVVSFVSSPDFETQSSYVITVIATDEEGNAANQNVTITITDVDEVRPTVVLTSTSGSTVFATTFELKVEFSEEVIGFDASSLSIENGTASNLTGAASVYSLEIQPIVDGEVSVSLAEGAVTDIAGNENIFSNTIERIVEATNEAPTGINLSTEVIQENTEVGFELATLSAVDVDLGDSHTFALVAGEGDSDNSSFKIIGKKLVTKGIFDFEEKSTLSVRIRATDAKDLNFVAIKTIEVANVDEPIISVSIPNQHDPTLMVSNMSFEDTRLSQTNTLTFTVSNIGTDGNLEVASIELPAGFSIDSEAFVLAPGESKELTVSFTPILAKVYSGIVDISSNAGNVMFNIAGLGTANSAPVAITTANAISYATGDVIQLEGYDPDGDEIGFEIITEPALGSLVSTGNKGEYTFIPNGLSPEIMYDDVIEFKVVETVGGLSSETAEYQFNFQITDEPHSITGLSFEEIGESEMDLLLVFEDNVFNDNYNVKLEYLDITDLQNITSKSIFNNTVSKSSLTIDGATASFGITAQVADHLPLFSAEKVLLTAEITTSNGYSDIQYYLLTNEATGVVINEVEDGASNDGEFFVIGQTISVPENQSVKLNLVAVDFGAFALNEAEISISKGPLKGTITSPVEAKREDNLAVWSVTYSSDTEVALLDSLEFSVYHSARDETSSAYAKISVIEVADAPVIGALMDQEIYEDGALIMDMEISDPDSEVEVTLVSSDPENVPVEWVNGQLVATPKSNFNGTVNISVLAKEIDAQVPLSDFDQFELRILAVNDKPQVTAIEDITINEDSELVLSLAATDVDAKLPIFEYTVEVDNEANVVYTLDGNLLTITPTEDFNGTLIFDVTVDDGIGSSNSVSNAEQFSVIVNPVNDSPEISANMTSQSLVEGFPSYQLNLAAYFTDVETRAEDLIYTISGVNNVITTVSGAILTITSNPGHAGVETAIVTASDGEFSVSQEVTFITTAASADVTLVKDLADLVLEEDFGLKTIDLTGVFAYSADGNATFTYSLAGNQNLDATINGNTIELNSVEDFNGEDQLYVVATVDGKSSLTNFNIVVNPVNDAPELASAISDVIVLEDEVFSKEISSGSFTDVDNDVLVYSASYEASWFSFDAATRTFSGTPENEDVGSVKVTLTATDPSDASISETFTITVNNTNDAPEDISLSSTVINENLDEGTVVATLSSIDIDEGNDSFIYSLVAGEGSTDNSSFSIVNGELVSNASFDFETKPSLSIRVRTDDGFEGMFEKVFTISVNNVNEVATNISLVTNTLAENQAAGTAIDAFVTTDPDDSDSHTYALVSGEGDSDNGSFEIVNGELVSKQQFNFEEKSSYSVRVKSTDAGGLTFEKTFAISITDANDAPTALSASNLTLVENESIGTEIGAMITTDEDASDSHVYKLVSGAGDTDNSLFGFVDGQLVSKGSFNFEARSSYQIRVKSIDSGGESIEAAMTVTITDANDAPTAISTTALELAENEAIGAVIGQFSSADEDAQDSHTYTLVSGEGDTDNASFEFDGVDLKAKESFNFETKSSYSIRVQSSDGRGGTIASQFTVNVTNVLEVELRTESSLTVPTIAMGETKTVELVLNNDGEDVLEITSITFPDAYTGSFTKASIAGGGSKTLIITFEPIDAGTYTGDITISSNAGTSLVSIVGVAEIVAGIEEPRIAEVHVKLYPNPASQFIELDLTDLNGIPAHLSIKSMNGTAMWNREEVRDSKVSIDVSTYADGVYLILVQTERGAITKRLLIKK